MTIFFSLDVAWHCINAYFVRIKGLLKMIRLVDFQFIIILSDPYLPVISFFLEGRVTLACLGMITCRQWHHHLVMKVPPKAPLRGDFAARQGALKSTNIAQKCRLNYERGLIFDRLVSRPLHST